MRLYFERWYPVSGAVLAGVVWYFLKFQLPTDEHEILNASLTLGAILTGFMSTAMTLLVSLHGSEVLKQLKDAGYITDLLRYLGEAIWFSFAFSAISIIGLFVDRPNWYGIVWIVFAIGSGLSFIRVTRITLKVIEFG